MVLVIGVACFNIVSTLVMAVKDKSADIAVLRTTGAKDGFIRAIFIWYGLLAGLLGSLSGVVIGVIASLQLTNIIRGIEKLVGHSFLSGDIYFIDFLPSELHWLDVLIVLATAIVLSLLASWYPAASQPHRSGAGAERTIKPTGRQRCRPVFSPGWVMYYGFDMGGTKIELGVFDDNLQRIWQKRVPTPREDYRQLLATLCDLTLEADAFCGRRGSVGIGIPGLPNDDDGTLFTANVPAAMGRPLPHDLAALIGREVRVDNDANCFALSEARRRVSPLPDGVGHHPRHRRRRWADRRRQDGARAQLYRRRVRPFAPAGGCARGLGA